MLRRPVLIGSEIYRRSSYGSRHPLSVQRVPAALDLVRAMGWLDDAQYVDSPQASPVELARFHSPDYISALMRVEREGRADEETRRRYNFGCNGNPIFPEMFRRPATACGGTLAAVALLKDGGIVYHPAGGTHHGRPDRASGFCYFNDPVLGILALIDAGIFPIYYVDVDAHHGDGVEDAFRGDGRVFTLSVHEEGRWPYTGRIDECSDGTTCNLPVPKGFNDAELGYLTERVIVPLGRALRPAAVVLQCGCDGLADDPMSGLALTNRGLWSVVEALIGLAPRYFVLGGGGYNPWAVARCWAGVWAVLNGIDPRQAVPTPAALRVLSGLRWDRSQGRNPPAHWLASIADHPAPGSVRPAIRDIARIAAGRLTLLEPPAASNVFNQERGMYR